MRTNSSIESMNAVLGKCFPPKPDIFQFTDCLREFEFMKVDMLQEIMSGKAVKKCPKRKNVMERDMRISAALHSFDEGNLSVAQYLESLAYEDIMSSVIPENGMVTYTHTDIYEIRTSFC